ncbi:MAG: MazG family protein [Anaerolineaceae bacterium]
MTQGQFRGQITIINNDSGSERRLPDAIREELVRFSKVHILGSGLPTADIFSDDIEVFSYEDILMDQDDLGRFEKIAKQLIEESEKDDLLLLVNNASSGKTEVCEELFKAASEERCRLRVVDSNGPFGALLLACGLDLASEFTVVDAARLARLHHPSFPPHIPAILPILPDRNALERIKPVLQAVYPTDHKVRIIQTGKNFEVFVKDSTLERMDASSITDCGASLIIPPLESERSFEAFQEIIAHLRAPEGCPWDREQTHLTLRKNLLEETYEALTALDDEDIDGMREEFGDLLLQIVLHAQIAAEAGEFRMGDVLAGINRKLVHRHPHVFGETEVSGVKGVLQNWERLKEDERAAKGQHEKGQLDGVPINLPSSEPGPGNPEPGCQGWFRLGRDQAGF